VAQAEAARTQAQQQVAVDKAALALATRTGVQARQAQNRGMLDLALTHGYLGEILHAMGEFDGAAAAYEAALAGFGEMRTPPWRDRVRTRSDLAILYRMRGDSARALPLQQQVLDELLPLMGDHHPDVQAARAELALLRKPQR
jgi:tetratricopeptide (TPR) repeat protein